MLPFLLARRGGTKVPTVVKTTTVGNARSAASLLGNGPEVAKSLEAEQAISCQFQLANT